MEERAPKLAVTSAQAPGQPPTPCAVVAPADGTLDEPRGPNHSPKDRHIRSIPGEERRHSPNKPGMPLIPSRAHHHTGRFAGKRGAAGAANQGKGPGLVNGRPQGASETRWILGRGGQCGHITHPWAYASSTRVFIRRTVIEGTPLGGEVVTAYCLSLSRATRGDQAARKARGGVLQTLSE